MYDFYTGTAAWTIPKQYKDRFPDEGSHLERYAQRLKCVEINSSFYKDHKGKTYERWANTTPDHFKFSVKLNKVFTHKQKLEAGEADLNATIEGIQHLGEKLGCLLVQLPPSLKFDEELADSFFSALREIYQGAVVIEPRHLSWGERKPIRMLREFNISRVIADPELLPLNGDERLDFTGLRYYRLQGSPEMYRSNYEKDTLKIYSQRIKEDLAHSDVWCLFDNTTFGFATDNALTLQKAVEGPKKRSTRKKD